MNRWILATLLALSVLVNVVVVAKLSDTRRDVEDLRRRVRVAPASTQGPAPTAAAFDAPIAAPPRNAATPATVAESVRGTFEPPAAALASVPMLADLDRFDAYWAALRRLENHRETLGDEYERTVMETTAAFLGLDPTLLATTTKQMIAECDAAETDEAYALARGRLSSLLRPESVRTHRFFIARLDDWICAARDGSSVALSGATFELKQDK